MRAAITAHIRFNGDFYRGALPAVLTITGLFITLAWELKTA